MVYVKSVNKRKFIYIIIKARLHASKASCLRCKPKAITISKVWLQFCYFSLNRPLAALQLLSASIGN